MTFILAWSEWDPNCDPNCPVTAFDHTVGELILLGIVIIVLYYAIENLAVLADWLHALSKRLFDKIPTLPTYHDRPEDRRDD